LAEQGRKDRLENIHCFFVKNDEDEKYRVPRLTLEAKAWLKS
jgi:hypothetical protein